MPSKPPPVSTLPPKPAAKRQRVAPGVELPSCGLPKPKRKGKAAPKIAKTAKKPPAVDTSPPWDGDREAYLAKQAVLMKHKGDPIIAPAGAMTVPGVSKRAKTSSTLEDGPMGGKLKRTRAEPAPPAEKTGKPATAKREPKPPMTSDLFAIICGEIAEGVTLRQTCRRPDMPSKTAFYEYLEECGDDDLRAGRLARYARARKLGFDALAEEALEIADDGTNDWIERERDDGTTYEALNGEHIQRSKLRFEGRLKLLAVWDPKRYGAMLKLGDPDGARLEQGNKSASDIAIDIAKLMVAAQREGGEAPGETLQ